MNQVTLRPKEMIHMFVSTFWAVWLSQTLKICGISLNKPENENEKNESIGRNKSFWR